MFLQPRKDIGEVEDGAVSGADWVGKGLKRDSTEIERKTLEGCAGDFRFIDAGAGTRGVSVFGGPF